MTTEFALDLRLARRKAGFTQRDAAHLLGVHQSTVSDLERGRLLPTVGQIVTLSLIYGRSFESLFAQVMRDARRELKERLALVPDSVRAYVGTFNRTSSLERLRQRLEAEYPDYGGA